MKLGQTIRKRTEVEICAPSWDEKRTDDSTECLRAIQRYVVAAAHGQGLTDSEISEDLNCRYRDLGKFEITRVEAGDRDTFWVDIN